MPGGAVRLRPAGAAAGPPPGEPPGEPVLVLARPAALPPTLQLPWLHAHAATFARAVAGDPAPADAPALALPVPPALADVAPRRLATFLAGRHCAAEALRAAGLAHPPAVGRLADGAPAWPAGVVGSITHTDDRAEAAVAPRSAVRGLGIDCERLLAAPAAAELRALVLAPDEAAALAAAGPAGDAALPPALLVTVLFSAKESVYKALRATVGAFFEFHDVHATALAPHGPTAGRVALRVARDLGGGVTAGATLEAAYAVVDTHVHTRVALAP